MHSPPPQFPHHAATPAPDPPHAPISLPAQLLTYPLTTLDNISTQPLPTLHHISPHSPLPSLPTPLLFRDFAALCDVFAALALAFMVTRTLFYVKRRRAGLIGPSLAPPLIKFWSLFAFLDFFLHLLRLYLAVFDLGPLVPILRAFALLVLLSGPRLSFSVRLYDTRLAPFYSSHQAEIEHRLATLRHAMARVDDAFKELGTYLLQRMAVGGLSGVAQGLSDIFSQAVQQDLDTSQFHQQQDQQQHHHVDSRTRNRQGERKNGVLVGEEDMELFQRGRQFFAGEPGDRAKALPRQSVDELMGVMQTASAEPPKAAYEEVRELRRRFRRRGSMMDKIKETGG